MHSAPGWVLCPSSIRTLTSLSAVDGTPSSSSSRRIFFSATTRPVCSCARRLVSQLTDRHAISCVKGAAAGMGTGSQEKAGQRRTGGDPSRLLAGVRTHLPAFVDRTIRACACDVRRSVLKVQKGRVYEAGRMQSGNETDLRRPFRGARSSPCGPRMSPARVKCPTVHVARIRSCKAGVCRRESAFESGKRQRASDGNERV